MDSTTKNTAKISFERSFALFCNYDDVILLAFAETYVFFYPNGVQIARLDVITKIRQLWIIVDADSSSFTCLNIFSRLPLT